MTSSLLDHSVESPTTGLSSPTTQLKLVSLGTVGFGIFMALGAHELTDAPMQWFTDLMFWPLGDRAEFTDEAQLVSAIGGGVMASWAALMWMLTDALADSQPKLLKRIIFTAMAVWFVIDSTGSIASGAWLNVIGNLGFLALFVVPASRLR